MYCNELIYIGYFLCNGILFVYVERNTDLTQMLLDFNGNVSNFSSYYRFNASIRTAYYSFDNIAIEMHIHTKAVSK